MLVRRSLAKAEDLILAALPVVPLAVVWDTPAVHPIPNAAAPPYDWANLKESDG